jgi:hypothetical protein
MTRAVVGGVLVVWLASALMVWSLVPQLVANDPSLVGSAADGSRIVCSSSMTRTAGTKRDPPPGSR